MDKDDYLNQISSSHRQLESYIFYFEEGKDGELRASERPILSWEEMYSPPVVDEFSFRDILAFIITWEKRLRGWLRTGLHQGSSEKPPLDVDWDYMLRVEDSHFDLERQQPVELLLPAMMVSYRETLDILETLSSGQIFEDGQFSWTGEKTLYVYLQVYMVELYDWARRHTSAWLEEHGKTV